MPDMSASWDELNMMGGPLPWVGSRSNGIRKVMASLWSIVGNACSIAENKRLAARKYSAPDQTKELGGSGSAPGVMPDLQATTTTNAERPRVGAKIWKVAGIEIAQQPAPAEWQQPPGQL